MSINDLSYRLGRVWRTAGAVALTAALSGCFEPSPAQLLTSAKDKLQRQEYRAATLELKTLLSTEPRSGEARFLMGRALLGENQPANALLEFDKAVEYGFSAAEVAPFAARAHVAQFEYEKALEKYGTAKAATPAGQADLLVELGTAKASLGNVTEAAQQANAALALVPDHAGAQMLLARLRVVASDVPGALAIVEKLTASPAANSEAWRLKGDLLLKVPEQRATALAAFTQAIKLDKKNLLAYAALIQDSIATKDQKAAEAHLAALEQVDSRSPLTSYYASLVAMEGGDLNKAREKVLSLLKVAPENQMGLFLAGTIEYRRGALLEADAQLNKVLKLNPGLGSARLLLSKNYVRRGDAPKALALLQPLLKAKPPVAEAFSVAAEAQIQLGEEAAARGSYLQAVQLDPNDIHSRIALALDAAKRGKGEDGVLELRKLAARDSGLSADVALVDVLSRRRDFGPALEAVAEMARKAPKSPSPDLLKARLEAARGNRAGARAALESALAKDSMFVSAAAALSALDIEEKRGPEAVKRFDAILAADPGNAVALLALYAVRMELGAPPEELAVLIDRAVKAAPQDSAPRIAQIQLEMLRKDYRRALTFAQSAVASLPDRPELIEAIGNTYALVDDTNQALSAYRKLAALQPNSVIPQMRLADLHSKRLEPVAAIAALRRALAIKPDYLPAQGLLVANQIQMSRYDEAKAVARTVQQQQPQKAAGFIMEGDIATVRHDHAAAAAAYRLAFKREPVADVAQKLYGALLGQGKSADADAFAADWRVQHPKDAALILFIADEALLRKDYVQAERYYKDVVAVDPNHALALNNLAWLSMHAGRSDALELAQKANRIQPRQPAFMDTLGQILARKGDLNQAHDLLSLALEMSPDNPVYKLHYADVLIRQGKGREAKPLLSELARLGSKFDRQPEVQQLMGRL